MCNEIRDYISEYIDGVASDEIKVKVESHLSNCKECKQLYEELLYMTSITKAIPQAEMPEGLEAKITAKLSKIKADQAQVPVVFINPRSKLYKRLASFAAIFVVGIFTITMYNNIDITDSDIYNASSKNSSQDSQKKFEQRNIEEFAAVADPKGAESSPANSMETPAQPTSEAKLADEDTGYVTGDASAVANIEEGYFMMSNNQNTGSAGLRVASRQSCRGIQKEAEGTFYKKGGSGDVEQVLMYMRCLEKELEGKEFQIKSSKKIGDEVWRFEVIVDSEPINYLGQGGEIWIETIEESSL